ncbi:hypothetical protein XENOCAPTIV_025760 [Xenoophorus captivus]|uniref:Uncharacterized protein n=1 Tax=Xenoophorus captivus TaxID=1517983 RepID=A0ABV0SI95_9TELE
MGLLWQSSYHAMTDRKSKQIKDSSTVEMPPPYTLPTPPTSPLTGLYPTLQVTGGHVSVCDLPPINDSLLPAHHRLLPPTQPPPLSAHIPLLGLHCPLEVHSYHGLH